MRGPDVVDAAGRGARSARLAGVCAFALFAASPLAQPTTSSTSTSSSGSASPLRSGRSGERGRGRGFSADIRVCVASPPVESSSTSTSTTSSTSTIEAGMVQVPGGVLVRGSDVGPADQRPRHAIRVAPFAMQATLVTVAAFRDYVDVSGAVTSAERAGFGKTAFVGMKDWEWRELPGASWRAPFGPTLPQRDDDPVTMVSWNDAHAYCAFYGLRLPTEIEWEYAMRAGATTRFPWGREERGADGAARFNHWEGAHHDDNPAVDGYVYRSPVRAYPPNAFGLYDAVGNLWQWTADAYAVDTYAAVAAGAVDGVVAHDVAERAVPTGGALKVARGGSWWCSANTCHGYGLVTRGKTAPQAAFSNNGFRCVRSAP